MNPTTPPNPIQEVFIQEPAIQVPIDTSLPAGQVLAEQNKDADEHLAPRFVP